MATKRSDKTAALEATAQSGVVLASTLRDTQRVLASGLFSLDYGLLKIGGVPPGRMIELFGPEQGGKSLLTYRWIAAAQRADKRMAALIANEGDAWDKFGLDWIERQGVDLDRLMLTPDVFTMEDTFDVVTDLLQSHAYSVVAVDSIANCYPRDMLKARRGENDRRGSRTWGRLHDPGQKAGAITEWVQTVPGLAKASQTLLIVTNQVRETFNATWGPGEHTPGGRALRHNAALRLELRRVGDLKRGTGEDAPVIGARSSVTVAKCKFSGCRGARTGVDTPGDLRIVYSAEDVVDEAHDVLYHAVASDLVVVNGAWYTLASDGLKVQGLDNFVQALRSSGRFDPLRESVVEKIREEVRHVAPDADLQ